MGPQVRRSINLYILRLIEEDVYIIKLNFFFYLGISTREVHCVRSDDETPASVESCSKQTKPESQKNCKLSTTCAPE